MENTPYLIWWIITLFISALLSGMEMAVLASDRMHYMMTKKDKGFLRHIVNRIYRHPRLFLSTLSTANIIMLTIFTYFSTLIIFSTYPTIISFANPITTSIIIAIVISIVILISGEILPRAIIARNPNFWVKTLAIPTYLLYIIFIPFFKTIHFLSKLTLSTFGIKQKESDEDSLNRTDIDSFLRKGIEDMNDVGDAESEVKILRNALEFSLMKVRDCMVPRADIVAISEEADIDTLKETFIDTGLSRILVYKEDIDNIIGYIHVWEMFGDTSDWTQRIAKISFVPESMQANKLMSELMQQHRSIAVVVDEFGGTSGIVTIEDLVEEIFGEIEDEFDDQSKFVKQYTDKEYVLSGRAEIDTINEEYGFELPESDDYSTIAGLLLHYTQRIPNRNEIITVGNYTFKILKVTTRKIEVVKLTIEEIDS